MFVKRLVIILAILGILFFLVYALYSIFYFSTVEISIEGEHDPTKSTVLVGNQKVYPSEKEGRFYATKVRPGTKTVSYRSFNTNMQEENIEFNFNSTEKIVFKTIQTAPEVTASNLVKTGPEERVSFASYFASNGPRNWLIIEVGNSDPSVASKFHVYKFSESDGWGFVIADTKLSTQDPLLADAPRELKVYLSAKAGD